MALGLQECMYIGNLDAKRNWGHAKDYVEGMWRILQQPMPEDFVLATGITTSIREMIKMAFNEVDVKLQFRGEGVNEVAYVAEKNTNYEFKIGQPVLRIDPKYFRPTEVDLLIGDPSKAKEKLGWEPRYSLSDLVSEMVHSDLKIFEKDKYLLNGGHDVLRQRNKFD